MSADDPSSPEEGQAILDRLIQLVGRGDREGALELAVRCEAFGEDHPLVLVLAAEAAEGQDDARAAHLLQRTVALDPDQGEAWRRLAGVLGRLGRLEQARVAADRALTFAPQFEPYLIAAGAAA